MVQNKNIKSCYLYMVEQNVYSWICQVNYFQFKLLYKNIFIIIFFL